MRRFIAVMAVIFISMIYAVSVNAAQITAKSADFNLIINDKKEETENSVFVINNRTYLPLRELSELLNLYVVWNEEDRIIKISDIGIINENKNEAVYVEPGEYVSVNVVNFKVMVDGYIKDLDNEVVTFENKTYLPLREIAEMFDLEVEWLDESKTIFIRRNNDKVNEAVLLPFIEDDLYGYMDAEGNIVIEPQYPMAFEFSEGMAAVCNENYEFGYIDTKGELVIPYKYSRAGSFSEGLAAVAM